MKIKKIILSTIICLMTVISIGCNFTNTDNSQDRKAPKISGLSYESTMKLDYAEGFDVFYYKGGYKLINVYNDSKYLIVPQGKKTPDDLDDGIIVLKQPLHNMYLAATSSMALFDAISGMDSISMTSLQKSGWEVKGARKSMANGSMVYAGKYNEPDYELLLKKNCDVAIESTMIYHSPDVKEMLEDIGIPVFVDRSSYENNPLGRTEWIKLYGALIDKEENASKFFDKQVKIVDKLNDFKNTEKTVAFFYITTDGKVVVKRSSDYVPEMIRMAGGRYAFDKINDDNKESIAISMESFYDYASDVDYIIYNGSIDRTVKSIKDLKAKDPILSKIKAVKEGNCWNTGSSIYQRTDITGDLIMDIHKILVNKDEKHLKFLTKME